MVSKGIGIPIKLLHESEGHVCTVTLQHHTIKTHTFTL